MWAGIKSFFRRHRRKFVIGGVAVVGVYLAARYAKWRIEEWKEQQDREFIEQARKQHHFESNQRTCTVTLYSLIPSLRDTLLEKVNSEEITSKLREKSSNMNKIELWEQLKILSFSRTITAVYSSCMLLVFLRVQLNIIGGYMYLDSMGNIDGKNDNGKTLRVAETVQKKYLGLVKYLLSEGLEEMIIGIQRSTQAILDEISLKEKFTPHGLEQIINHIRQTFEFSQHACHSSRSGERSPLLASSRPFCRFMIPQDLENFNVCADDEGGKFLHLVEETLDVLESDDCNAVLQSCLDTGFKHLMENIAAFFQTDDTDMDSTPLEQVVSLPLAKIIPIINGQIHHLFSDPDNSYIQDLFKVKCTSDFAANLYEAFCCEVD